MTKELEKGEKATQPTLIARRTAESPVQRAAFSGFSDDVDYNTRPDSSLSPLAAFSPFSSFSYNLLRSRGYRAGRSPGEDDRET